MISLKEKPEKGSEGMKEQEKKFQEKEEKDAETSAENIEEKEADKKDSEEKAEDKKDDLEDQIKAKDAEIADWKDKYQRLMAEFENARKRMSKESTQRYDMGAMGVLEKLLPVIDNFERGLESVSEEEKNSAFVQGIQQIYKQLISVMEDLGVTPMDAEGKEFDANLHNAVMHVEDEELGGKHRSGRAAEGIHVQRKRTSSQHGKSSKLTRALSEALADLANEVRLVNKPFPRLSESELSEG